MFDETVDIIIPVWNQLELTKKCLNSISENTKIPFHLIIIDNGSDDETREYLRKIYKYQPECLNTNLAFLMLISYQN